MEFSGPEYWSGFPFPPPGDLPNPGIEPGSATLQVDSLPSEPLCHIICFDQLDIIKWVTDGTSVFAH